MSKEGVLQPTAFTGQFARDYENWSDIGRHYEALTRAIAKRIQEEKPDAEQVLEIGSGTGNSAVVLLEGLPRIQLYGVEPSDFLQLAVAKWKNKGSVAEFYTAHGFPLHPYSEEVAKRLQPHRNRLFLFKDKGEKLSFVNDSIDAVAMCQVFHWFKEKQDQALSEMRRVLKPGGVVVFDESGAQLDFGESKEGQELNGKFIHSHPFARLFRANLDKELQRNGHQPISSAFKYQFTYDSLRDLYANHGFEFVDTPDGAPYQVTVRPDPIEKVMIHEKTARMRVMASSPELLKNPSYVDGMVNTVTDRTKKMWETGKYDDGKPYGATAATFVARKIA